jgi:hypothetical protein
LRLAQKWMAVGRTPWLLKSAGMPCGRTRCMRGQPVERAALPDARAPGLTSETTCRYERGSGGHP